MHDRGERAAFSRKYPRLSVWARKSYCYFSLSSTEMSAFFSFRPFFEYGLLRHPRAVSGSRQTGKRCRERPGMWPGSDAGRPSEFPDQSVKVPF